MFFFGKKVVEWSVEVEWIPKFFSVWGHVWIKFWKKNLCPLMKFSWTCGLMKLGNLCILAILVRNEVFFEKKNRKMLKNWLFWTKNYFFEKCLGMSSIRFKVLKNKFFDVFDPYFTTYAPLNIHCSASLKPWDGVEDKKKSCQIVLSFRKLHWRGMIQIEKDNRFCTECS